MLVNRRLLTLSRAGIFAVLVLAAAPLLLHPQAPVPLTVEDIYSHGPIGGTPPQSLTWSPDGSHLTYLEGGELIDLDPVTGTAHVLVSRAKLSSLTGDTTTTFIAVALIFLSLPLVLLFLPLFLVVSRLLW